MKYVDEYRDQAGASTLVAEIKRITTKPWNLMEVCGGQTHSIVRFGIDELLPEQIQLIHGPGCPVCVTPVEIIDKALQIASQPNVIFCSFGDMLRVPGTKGDLFSVKAAGGDVRIVYSPLDAVAVAVANPSKEVVFFAVGFETTAPANAMAVKRAAVDGVHNFGLLVSHVLVPPAIEAIMSSPKCRIQGFLAAGHVCTVMGYDEYYPLAKKFHVPIVVTGFEPIDILQGILMCVRQLEDGRAEVENQYSRVVKKGGNPLAQSLIAEIFEVVPRKWRGIGPIPHSGLGIREKYQAFDADRKFGLTEYTAEEDPACLSGLVLQGLIKPHECPEFGKKCTPENPLGAPMVSNEGACSAYYRYRRAGTVPVQVAIAQEVGAKI
jgi:hydrogenase expression/formation protein HypD